MVTPKDVVKLIDIGSLKIESLNATVRLAMF